MQCARTRTFFLRSDFCPREGSGFGGPGFGQSPTQQPEGKKKDEDEIPQYLTVPEYTFVVQFVWQEQLLTDRLEMIRQRREAEKQEAEKAAAAAAAKKGAN